MALRLKFDPHQPHQLAAVDAVVALFDGLPRRVAEFSLGEEIVANLPAFEDLAPGWLLANLGAVQAAQGLDQNLSLEMDDGPGLEGIADESHRYPSFTVEMETGTGKTYVYLRTVHELRRRYGFSKFIVVVPSIAIFEGVIKNFQITRDHFRALYGNETVNLVPYDGAQLSRLRSFATSTFTEIMVMTLDAFNKPSNNIYKPSEKLPGELRPFQCIQATRPILILDEPQNMESARAREALRTLKPLLALRYSATHRSSPNPVYRLTPFQAYQRGLVKRIQVYGVTERENVNAPILSLQDITTAHGIRATVRTLVTDMLGTREADVVLRHGDDLYAKTRREDHRGGYVVDEINAAQGFVHFVNGETLWLHAAAPTRPEIFRQQIRETIREHMALQERLQARGIKVLSLFFIDRVANYTAPDGLIRRLFDEEYERLRPDFPFFRRFEAARVRDGYFARKKAKDGTEEAVDTESRNADERAAEKRAFELIMRDKERLLSFDEPVCFVFAHSALKEGWDNPNVFQICTLNQTHSEIKKRQEIGRGLRLCVNQQGERVFDEEVNVLTVVANESYRSYASNLQREYTEAGDAPPPLPTDARRKEARRNDDIYLHCEPFQEFWRRLGRRVRYRIHVDTDALVEECVARLARQTFPRPVIVVERGRFVMASFKIKVESVTANKAQITLKLFDEEGNPQVITAFYRPGDSIAKVRHDDRLRPLGTVAIQAEGGVYKVAFTNTPLVLGEDDPEFEYTPEVGGRVRERQVLAPTTRHAVFNLLDRAAKQTGLTRPTVNRIFKQLPPDKKRALLDNPEGFANVFVAEVRNALADHVAERIEFVVEEGEEGYDLGELFPPTRRYPQKEVVEAGRRGLYDLVQKDSEVEQRYVEAIKEEGDAILFYFKFPPEFKVRLPDMIGNYVPDWGVARVYHNGDVGVQPFVHETKGSVDVQRLQFPHEKRKIRCAQKYFEAIGISYLTIDPQVVVGWWERAGSRQLGLM